MYYGTTTITMKVGKRYAGIAHLKKLAEHINHNYNFEAEVLGNVTGKIYQSFLIVKYENLAQGEEFNENLGKDESFQEWFDESVDLFDWEGTTSNIFRVM